MTNFTFTKFLSALGILGVAWLIFQCVKWQSLAPSMDLPDVVWAKCLLKEQCAMPLSEYRTDLDWDNICIEYYEKTNDGEPCGYCNVVTLSKNNTLIHRKIINLPTKEDIYIVHFEVSIPNTKQCYNKNSTHLLAHQTHDYGLINYGVKFVSSPNS